MKCVAGQRDRRIGCASFRGESRVFRLCGAHCTVNCKKWERGGEMKSVRRKINIKSATRQRRSLTVCHLPAQNFANSCQRKERTDRQQTVPAVPPPTPLAPFPYSPSWVIVALLNLFINTVGNKRKLKGSTRSATRSKRSVRFATYLSPFRLPAPRSTRPPELATLPKGEGGAAWVNLRRFRCSARRTAFNACSVSIKIPFSTKNKTRGRAEHREGSGEGEQQQRTE